MKGIGIDMKEPYTICFLYMYVGVCTFSHVFVVK